MGRRNGRWLRFYGFTDLGPSLPLPRADSATLIPESKRRRKARAALSGLSGRRHGRWCRFAHPRAADARVRPNFLTHLYHKCVNDSQNEPLGPHAVDSSVGQYKGSRSLWTLHPDQHHVLHPPRETRRVTVLLTRLRISWKLQQPTLSLELRASMSGRAYGACGPSQCACVGTDTPSIIL